MGNLNTQAALTLRGDPPEYAAIHLMPMHGSWLNMAEFELLVLARHCLERRIESPEKLRHEFQA